MSKKHNGTIDFLKFLFACLILAFHGNSMIDPKSGFFLTGAIGVEFFFLVSGYLMAASAQRALQRSPLSIGPETAKYIWKKVKTLFPFVFGAFIITLVVRESLLPAEKAWRPAVLYKSVWEPAFLWISGIGKTTINAPTWYISAMLMGMLFLYPMLLKNFELFIKVVAPIIAIFLIGWLTRMYGHLFSPPVWTGHFYKGFLRGVAELCLGCVCFAVSQWLMRFRMKPAGKWLLAIAEWGSYGFVFYVSTMHKNVSLSTLMLLALTIGITISFSQQSATASWFRSPVFPFLGQLSLTVYLIHYSIRKLFIYWKPNLGYWAQMGLFALVSLVLGLLYLLLINGIMKLISRKRKAPAV